MWMKQHGTAVGRQSLELKSGPSLLQYSSTRPRHSGQNIINTSRVLKTKQNLKNIYTKYNTNTYKHTFITFFFSKLFSVHFHYITYTPHNKNNFGTFEKTKR